MPAELYEKLKLHSKKDVYPFHMPGHKMGRGMNFENPWSMDITEIDGFDNLHHAEGVIADAQKKAALTFGADHTFFVVNGSSCGLMAAVMAACKEGEKIIVSRNCHKSVFSGLVLSGAQPVYIMPENIDGFGIAGGVSTETVEKAIEENKDAKAVVLVSPTFEGAVSDIEKISEIAHKNGMIVIVDEAHGAHFKFNSFFPETALDMGADIIIQSAHKTLPVPTQVSLVHVKGKRCDLPRLKTILAMLQSSSPSYLFMASVDICREYLDTKAEEDFEKYVENLKGLRGKLSKLKNFRLLDADVNGKYGIKEIDLGKIVLSSDNINCIEVSKMLDEKYGLIMEMSCPGHLAAMTSVSDEKSGFDRLAKAFEEIDNIDFEKNAHDKTSFDIPVPKVCISPRDAFYKESTSCDFEKAAGKIAAEFVIPYPPGIPVCTPGEEITAEAIEILKKYKKFGGEIIGMKDSDLEKIQVLM
ncbi:MAG: aminotransferase class I/II-fold pyridoxal phosphate-dependent enzyme [Firmicutes bacterium]|nr:aminotransferase class I/II-fold pyridoxal phosphate-dependent enzyme [Bacillota bacterium]